MIISTAVRMGVSVEKLAARQEVMQSAITAPVLGAYWTINLGKVQQNGYGEHFREKSGPTPLILANTKDKETTLRR